MRSAGQLLRTAAHKLGWTQQAAGSLPLRGLPSWLGSSSGLVAQQCGGLATGRRKDDEEEELEGGEHKEGRLHHRPSHTQLFERVDRELAELQEEETARERQRRIRELIQAQPAVGAGEFVDRFFGEEEYMGESYAYDQRLLGDEEGEEEGGSDWEEGEEGMEISTPEELSEQQAFDLEAQLGGLRKGAQRSVLQKLLQGGMLQADPEAMREWQEIQRQFQPPEDFRMKVVDVNYTCKGTKTGGLYRYSCMVVVGNGEGVLGWGQGKAAETADAVQKAYLRACKNLFPIPRYNGHTIPEPMTAKFGKVKVIMYPKAAGNGITSSDLVYDICKMAGLHDVGIKVCGSRNPRSTVKCLFEAFDKLRTHEEVLGQEGKVTLAAPPGRYGVLRQPKLQRTHK